MRSPSENIATIKNYFPFTMLSPGHGDLTIKITCRHARGKKYGATYLAGMAEGEEIGIKTQKAAEQERVSPSLLTPCAPGRHPLSSPSPTFVTATRSFLHSNYGSTLSSSPAASFTDGETQDQRGNGPKPWF